MTGERNEKRTVVPLKRFFSLILALLLTLSLLPSLASADARSRLSEKDRNMYDFLKEQIVRAAEGNASSTVFRYTRSGFPAEWTASDLGVSSIVRNGGISPDAADALASRMSAYCADDAEAVLHALLADLPFELYWYDKTGKTGYGLTLDSPAFKASSDRWGSWVIYPASHDRDSWEDTVTVEFRFEMPVTKDCGAGAVPGVVRPNAARENAQKIVKKYAGEDDWSKLLGYASEICALTEYAYAADEDPYGNPWQLMSVLDGNSATKAMCEGYAKAFKYLCDLTRFDSPKIECRLVSGTTQSKSGTGSHMWNVVTMDDGKNYLVDVTNSDINRDPSYLFLKGEKETASGKYGFGGWITYEYDSETVDLWGKDLLLLAGKDYPVPKKQEPPKEPKEAEKPKETAEAKQNKTPFVPQVIGQVLSTDIRAFINGAEIPSYNIDGRLAVLVSDLNGYGFKTQYNNDLRKTTVTRDRTGGQFASVPSKTDGLPVGTPVMSVYSTDITVEMDGRTVTAFNVDNRMAVYFTELNAYGTVVYDNNTRTSSLKLK